MAINRSAKIFPHFWYVKEAEEAARFYASIFPNSSVDRITALMADSPSGPAGTCHVVDFTLFGQPFQAISAGPLDKFNHAVSMVVVCDDQAELDRYWNALLEGGGETEACGWLRDRYGLCWQIVPAKMDEWMNDQDPVRAKRTAEAMMKMVNLVIATRQAAYDGKQ